MKLCASSSTFRNEEFGDKRQDWYNISRGEDIGYNAHTVQ